MSNVVGYMTDDAGKKCRIHHGQFKIGKYDFIFQYCRGKNSKWRTTNGIDDFQFFEKESKMHGLWKRRTWELWYFSLMIKHNIATVKK